MALGKSLKALRQKQNLNQNALSALSGVSQATISRIETGRVRQLRSSALKHLADALGVTVDFLMGDNDIFAQIPSPGELPSNTIPGVREDRFRQIADTLEAFVVHEQGRFLYVNQTFADMLGYRKAELLGKNGIELVIAPQSRSLVQRMVSTVATEPYEVLLMRKDHSLFPAQIAGKNLTENIRLALVHDITIRRSQQAAIRLQQAGLEVECLEDLSKIVRIVCDELEDQGLPLEGVGINLIDESQDRLMLFMASPESKGYRSFQDDLPLQETMEKHAPIRGLVSNWRRDKVWEREADEEFRQLMRVTSAGSSFQPGLIIDIPTKQGSLMIGMAANSTVHIDDLLSLLRTLSLPLSCLIKRLQAIETLNIKLREMHQRITV